jgi:DNA-binding MarR family transcriptional regulator
MSDFEGALELARAMHRSGTLLSRRLMASRGAGALSLSKLSVLGRLRREGAATATELAAYLRIQPQSLTRLLASLEDEGLIVRRADKTDRRQNQIGITIAGERALIGDVRERRVKLAQAIARELTPTELSLLRLSAGLIERLAAAVDAAGDTSDAA